MVDNTNLWRFERGLKGPFMDKLKKEAEKGGWFADVLADTDLILGIRKDYMNVYRFGQSLFKIEWPGEAGPLKVSTHPKYLVDPDLYKPVPFDGSTFEVRDLQPLVQEYERPKTLRQMKRAAEVYCGDEKKGVHAIALANPDVIDMEVAFGGQADEESPRAAALRIDLAWLADVNGSNRLSFWEAKLYKNPEIRAEGDKEAPVVEQVRGYQRLVREHKEEIIKSYRGVAENLAEMAGWVDGRRKIGELIKRAKDEAIVIDDPPVVGLAIYRYKAADRKSDSWKIHIDEKLTGAGIPVRCKGEARGMRLEYPG